MDKNKPIGSYYIMHLLSMAEENQESKDGKIWKPARPIPYYSLKERLKMALDVLTYKADALYW